MKNFFAFMILTVSVSALAQTRVELNSKEISVNDSAAIIVRTANTPDKVEITFQVPMANTFCAEYRDIYIRQTCNRTETAYRTERRCRREPISSPTSNVPRGPNYNPPTREVCTDVRVNIGSRNVAYDCSYTRNDCVRREQSLDRESDTVKIKFKNLPDLAGSETEEFRIEAQQRSVDGTNVVYDISTVKSVNDAQYEVKSKGIFGYDSYVIQPK